MESLAMSSLGLGVVTLCECGCGSPAPITRGRQRRFVVGHNGRVNLATVRPQQHGTANHRWLGDAAHSNGIHTWIRRNWKKQGACETCGKDGRTDWAFLYHPEPHTRERSDYIELCRSCHVRFDHFGLAWQCRPWGLAW